MAIAHRFLVALALLVPISVPSAAQSPAAPGEWSGTWRGTLLNLPTRPNAPAVEVIREIGTIPASDSTCAARWLGDELISPFKYDNLVLISTLRLRDDVLEEEILTVADRPAVQGALSLRARGMQRMRLRRVSRDVGGVR